MRWWKNTDSSSSSPSSTSSSPRHNPKNKLLWSRRNSEPRLTRQRKLRHGDGTDLAALAIGAGSSSAPVSRSPSELDCCEPTRSSSSTPSPVLLPWPLPLPEDAAASSRRDLGSGVSTSSSVGFPLPSPIGASSRAEGEEDSSVSLFRRRSAHQIVHRSSEHRDIFSNGSAYTHHRKVLQDMDSVESETFRLNVPAKSAPTSGLSSPVRSPRRSSNVDFSTSTMTTQRHQVWSAPEISSTDRIAVLSLQTSPEKFIGSPDLSPRYRPGGKGPLLVSNYSSAPPSPLHSKMFPERFSGRHDSNGNVNVHPLPLPPGASVPTVSCFVPQTAAKPEVCPMSGQWQKGKPIGSGTFGNVFEATNRHTGALCAMKEVNIIPDDPKSAECIKQLEQEIKFLSQFKHQNIVQYYGSEIIDDRFFIYLEYVHPGSMNKYVRQHCGAMTESVVRNFTRHILNGLDYLHSKKIMHRDIKGANLLVDINGVVKLADFGMAKHLSAAAPDHSLKGTSYWMAPEVLQATMNKEITYDLAVDIWSLGCTIIEMFTGKHPWNGLEGPAALFKVLNKDPPIPETLSSDGKDFLQCCFRRNPADRPTANKLLEHPFIRNSHHYSLHGSIQAFEGIKLSAAYSPSERIRSSRSDSYVKGKQSMYGETSRSYPETTESAAMRPSSRSNPEFSPSLSPRHANHIISSTSSFGTDIPNDRHLADGNFHPCALPKTHGKEGSNLLC
ncbi:mitogen-activated protein kinase kinase kinase 5-like isoform X1 [Typha angustifolia]|uniref:mitogen-activated protein kinase kinase kinase 5-like isoform X1 n=1 Tax=Typha angustifolia TaxID=59011 RepID=UPI003C2E9D1F